VGFTNGQFQSLFFLGNGDQMRLGIRQ
jgi:hypothetical protein